MRLSFDVSELRQPLYAELTDGFSAMSIGYKDRPPFAAVTLWRSDRTGLRLRSAVEEFENWLELGRLVFSHPDESDRALPRIALPKSMQGNLSIEKLVIVVTEEQTEPFEAESGLVFTSSLGGELIVVSGEFPFSITASSSFLPIETFTPEHDLARYEGIQLVA